MDKFNVEQTMEEIRSMLKERKLRDSQLYYVSRYHNRMIKQLLEAEEIVLFGAGEYGKIILKDLQQQEIHTVKCFCDNNKSLIGSEIEGIKVLSPEDAVSQFSKAYFVVSPKDYMNEILRQLVHMGIEVDCILLFDVKNAGLVVI